MRSSKTSDDWNTNLKGIRICSVAAMSAPEPPTPLPDINGGPRNFITTAQDHGGIALVICTLMATWVFLCFLVRLYMRATVSGPFGIDDIVCSIATVFGVVQMIVSSAAVSFGFGKALELLTDSQILKASKAVYAAQLLYLITNALTKGTVALLLARIVFIKSRVYACYGVLLLSCIWGLASFLFEAIRCTEYAPWTIVGTQCPNMLLAWQLITAFNVIIESLLFAMPIWLVWGLQTDMSKKIVVVAVFSLRLPVIAAAILRVHFLANSIGSSEPLLNGVVPFICMNIEMHYGLMAATMPTLKPFVGAFNTGWGTYDTTGASGYGQHSAGSYAMNSLANKSNKSNRNGRKSSTPKMGTQSSNNEKDPDEIRSFGKNVTHIRSVGSGTGRVHSAGSTDSQQMFIHQTTTCEVHIETDDPRTQLRSSRGEDSIEYARKEPVSPVT